MERKAQRALEQKEAFINAKKAKAHIKSVRVLKSKVIQAQGSEIEKLNKQYLTLKLTKAAENKQKILENKKLVALKFSTRGCQSQARETSWVDMKMRTVTQDKEQLLKNKVNIQECQSSETLLYSYKVPSKFANSLSSNERSKLAEKLAAK